MLLLFSCVILLVNTLAPTALIFGIILLMAVFSGLLKDWSRSMAKALPFLAIVIVLDTVFSKTAYGQVYFSYDLWILHPSMSYGSIIFAITMGFRFISFIGISTLFLMTTKFEDFVKGLRKLMVPYTFAFSLGLSLRSITYLTSDVKNIMDSQRSRGLEIDKKDLIKNYRRFLALFIPVIICLLLRSRNIAEAMQVRAFRYKKNPTMYKGIRFGKIDYGFMLMIIILVVVLVRL